MHRLVLHMVCQYLGPLANLRIERNPICRRAGHQGIATHALALPNMH